MAQTDQPGWWRGRRARHIVGSVVLFLVALLGVGVVVRSWFETRDETDRTDAALRDTRDELAQAGDDLATATIEFVAARTTLGGEAWTLDMRQSERDAAQDALDTTGVLLADLEAQLEAATADLADGTARLDALGRCLVGVAGALNQASVGDTSGLAATIRSIEGTCAEAGVVL
jgi:hypothetical protein